MLMLKKKKTVNLSFSEGQHIAVQLSEGTEFHISS